MIFIIMNVKVAILNQIHNVLYFFFKKNRINTINNTKNKQQHNKNTKNLDRKRKKYNKKTRQYQSILEIKLD